MANTIQIKRSSTASNVPTAGELAEGELAINTNPADRALYSKDSGGTVFQIGAGTIGGTISDNQVAVGAAVGNTIEGSANLTWDGSQFLLPLENDAVTPTLAFGDGDSGFYELSDDTIRMAIAGVAEYQFSSSYITGASSASFHCDNGTASRTVATIGPRRGNSGFGAQDTTEMSIILSGTEMIRFIDNGTYNAILPQFGLFIAERAAADVDIAAYGQIWVENDAPNRVKFTDDAGADWPLQSVHEAEYAYSSTVTAGDPGAYTLRFDSVTIGSIANMYIDDLSRSEDWDWVLSNLADGDLISIKSALDPADYIIATVNGTPTDGTGYWTVPLTLVHTGTIFTNGDPLRVSIQWFSQAGGGGTIGGSITDNQIAIGASTSNSIEGSANFTFDVSTGTIALYDSLGTSLSDIQRTATTLEFDLDVATDDYIFRTAGASRMQILGNSTIELQLNTNVSGTLAATTVTGANVTSGVDPGHTHTAYQAAGSYLSNVVEDTTPQLGGVLDMQTYRITGNNGGSTGASTATLQASGVGTTINAGTYASFYRTYSAGATGIGNNVYVDSDDIVAGQVRYAATHASLGHTAYELSGGNHYWYGDSASVTADAIVTKKELMRLSHSGSGLTVYDDAGADSLTFSASTTDGKITSTQHVWMSPAAGHSIYGYTSGQTVAIGVYDGSGVDSFFMKDDGSIAYLEANNNNIYLRTNATNVAWANTNGDFYAGANLILNTNNTGIYGRDSGGTVRKVFSVTNIDDIQIGDVNLSEIVFYNQLKLQEKTAASADSSAFGQIWVKDDAPNTLWFTDDTGVDYPVGTGAYKLKGNASFNMTTASVAEQMVNAIWYKTNTTAYTLTLETSSTTNFPAGAQLTIVNAGSSGNLTITDQTTNTCYVLDGSSKTDIAGTATIAPGGYATLIRISTTETWLMGSGITA